MAAPIESCGKYLFRFANEHLDFRIAELKAIAMAVGTRVQYDETSYDIKHPYLKVKLPSEQCAKNIMSRTVLVRSVFELLAEGQSRKELYSNMKRISTDIMEPYLKSDISFKFTIETFNKTTSMKDKIKRIEDITDNVLQFKGQVKLKNPDHNFFVLEYYGSEANQPTEEPLQLYFGRWVADGQRDKINQYHLQKRLFIGNTSMDAALSLIMANMGMVQRNMLVFDPFVGTGSLLVAAAHHGAYVMGTDLDYMLLHAKAKPSRTNQKVRSSEESIQANLQQYGHGNMYVSALVADASLAEMWRQQPLFDAIITDPPYGIREGAKKLGKANPQHEDDVKQHKDNYIPPKMQYELSDIYLDLLNFAAIYLVPHGRLVYWLPVYRPQYTDDNVPVHPCLELVSNCEQPISTNVGRRLITMVKKHQPKSDKDRASYRKDHYESSFRDRYFSAMGEHTQHTHPAKSTQQMQLIDKSLSNIDITPSGDMTKGQTIYKDNHIEQS